MPDLQKGTTFVDGVSIANASNLNNLVDLGTILPGFIADKTNLVSPSTGCEIVLNDAGVLKKVTLANLAAVISGGLDIHGLPVASGLTNADEFVIWEDTGAANRKITYANLISELENDLNVAIDTGLPDILTGTATFDPPALIPGDEHEQNFTVTGASTAGTPAVIVTPSIYWTEAFGVRQARVTGANTVQVSFRNFGDATINVGSHTIRVVVIQF